MNNPISMNRYKLFILLSEWNSGAIALIFIALSLLVIGLFSIFWILLRFVPGVKEQNHRLKQEDKKWGYIAFNILLILACLLLTFITILIIQQVRN